MNIELNFLSEDIYNKLVDTTEKSSLNSDLTRYRRKINQCNLILGRIIENTKSHRKLDDLVWDENQSSDERAKAIHEYGIVSSYINLDTEDYFIHTKILMDKIATVLARYIDELPREKITSFVQLVNYLKHNSFQNKDLQNILDQEKWFALLINVHRNNLIIHDSISEMSGTAYSKTTLNRPIRLVFPDDNDSKQIQESLNKIKENHLLDITEFQNESNIWTLLLICDYNAEKLSDDEIETVKKIHRTHGGELPQIDFINRKIQNFLDRISSNFLKI
jgi:hypothetical protein